MALKLNWICLRCLYHRNGQPSLEAVSYHFNYLQASNTAVPSLVFQECHNGQIVPYLYETTLLLVHSLIPV